MEQLLVTLLLWIGQHSTFEYHPDMELPVVEQVSQQRLAELYVGEGKQVQGFMSDAQRAAMVQHLSTSLEAVYAADKNTIFLGQKIDPESPYGRSVMVHELIHFLQREHEYHTKVACNNALEKDAYFIQAEYMKQNQLVPPFNKFTVLMRSICDSEF